MKKHMPLLLAFTVALLLVCFALCGCAVDQSWRPAPGEDYATTRTKLDSGTKYITIEGDEVRWWFEHPAIADHWIYYARFDRHIVRVQVFTAGELTQDRASDAKLVEWAQNRHAYREAALEGPRW